MTKVPLTMPRLGKTKGSKGYNRLPALTKSTVGWTSPSKWAFKGYKAHTSTCSNQSLKAGGSSLTAWPRHSFGGLRSSASAVRKKGSKSGQA